MELDDLKKQLNLTINSDHPQRSAHNIFLLMKGSAVSLLYKIRKSILLEIIISIVFTVVSAIVLLFSHSWMYYLLFSTLGVIAIAFILVLYFLLRKVNSTLHTAPVKENVLQLVNIIKEYSKRYLQLTLFLLPVCFASGVWLSYNNPESVLQPLQLPTIMALCFTLVLMGIIVYFFTRWYLRKLYGKYLEELTALVEELKD